MSIIPKANLLSRRIAPFALALLLGLPGVPSLARAEGLDQAQPSEEPASVQVDQAQEAQGDQAQAREVKEEQAQAAQVDKAQAQADQIDQARAQAGQDQARTQAQADQDEQASDATTAEGSQAQADPGRTQAQSEQNEQASDATAAEGSQAQADQESIATQARIEDISHGNVTLTLTAKEIEAVFEYGDILSVSFLDKKLDMPLGTSYSDVDTGEPLVRANQGKDVVVLAINMGSFATEHGIAVEHEVDGTVTWEPAEGVSDPVDVTLTLKEAGGYYEEYVMRQLFYTDERGDYPDLTDDEFANFREVRTTGIRNGVLYRSATPVDPSRNRNAYADAAIKRVGVASILNLADSEADLVAFPGYGDTYYATVTHLAVPMGLDFQSPDSEQKLAQAMSFIANNPGPYDIHCVEGKDRTGYVVALLECLMGGSLDEVVADYMVSFQNYFGVTPSERRYEIIANGNIITSLKRAFGTDDLAATDLSQAAADYLASIGVTEDELAAIRRNLGPLPTYTVGFDMCGHGTAPEAQALSEGAFAVEPAAPSEDGFTFQGWYLDRDHTKAYDYSSPVTSDLTLYAKWVAKEASQDNTPKDSGTQAAKPAASTTPTASSAPKASNALPHTDDPGSAQPALAATLLGTSLLLGGAAYRARKRTGRNEPRCGQ